MKKFNIACVCAILLAGCASDSARNYPLVITPIRPNQQTYEIYFIPKAKAVFYDLKVTVRQYPISNHPPTDLNCIQEIYLGNTLIAKCDSKIGPGWWSEESMGFNLPPLDKDSEKWEFASASKKFPLKTNVTYKMRITFHGNFQQFTKDFSPAFMEISETYQYKRLF